MNFHIRGEHMQVTEALHDYVEKKVSRLQRYFETPLSTDVHVTLRMQRGQGTVEVTIPMPGVLMRGEETHQDMYAAIDLVVEKLERQVRKHKTKLSRRMKNPISTKVVSHEAQPIAVQDMEEDIEIDIVRTKRFSFKPMDAEEAVMQMDMLGHSFFVFQNSATSRVNVVYRRNDGRYGLIEPQ